MGINLLDRDLYAADPHPAFTALRATTPIYHDADASGLWALTKHDDVVWAERQPALFTNTKGSRPNGYPQPSMIDTDDPQHNEQRRLVARGFTPKQMANYETHVREVLGYLIDRLAAKGSFDVVADLAKPLPMTLIGEMLGAPKADFDTLQRWSDEMITASDDPRYLTDAVIHAAMEWTDWLNAAMAERQGKPASDIIGILLHASEDGGVLTPEQVNGNALLLLVGGNETTRNVITGGLHALLTRRDQWDALVADPALIPGAVEECLRWVSPILNMNRVTTQDVERRGVTIPEGSQVLMHYMSANRDEDVFADPFRFDVRRTPNNHVAFGFGSHFCLGSSLARLEIRLTLEELARRLPSLRLADAGFSPAYSHSTFVRGMQALPVTL